MRRHLNKCFLIAAILLGAVHAHSAECAKYEPVPTELTGELILRDYPGPPNFESVESGDQLQRAWILVLDSQLCVDSDPTSDINADSVEGESEVQLVLSADPRSLQPYRDRTVRVSGTLFAGHSGYHRTAVLMTVESMAVK